VAPATSRRLTVGVAIPTTGRSRLALAVRSVLEQSVPPDSIVVVVDGPKDLLSGLALPDDGRMEVISALPLSGVSAARNAGMGYLDTDLIALLDDDDEWLPSKLEREIEAFHSAQARGVAHPIIACRAVVQDWNGVILGTQPVYPLEPGQRVADYLLCRRRILPGGATMGASMLLFDSELASAVRFDVSLSLLEDWDWLFRADDRDDTEITQLSEVLTRHTKHADSSSKDREWQPTMAWVLRSGGLLSAQEQADCLLCSVAQRAIMHGDWRGYLTVLRRVKRMGAASTRAWLWITAGVFALVVRDHVQAALRRAKRAAVTRANLPTP
jgi:hypothetical protein